MRIAKMPHIYTEKRQEGKKITQREVYYRRFPKDVQAKLGTKFIHKWGIGITRQQASDDTTVPAQFHKLVKEAREQGQEPRLYSYFPDPYFGFGGEQISRSPQTKRFIAGIEVPLNFDLQSHLRNTLVAAPAEGPVGYESIIALWADTRATEGHPAKPKAVQARRRKMQGLFDWLSRGKANPSTDMAAVSAVDLQRYKEHLMSQGVERDEATLAHDHLTDIKYLFKVAAENHKLPNGNPAEKLKVPRKAMGLTRKPFTGAEAAAILIDAREQGPLIRWGQWLAAYTGAITSEIIQARRSEFKQIAGIWVWDMTERREMKTAYRARGIPLHPALLREGLLDFLAQSGPGLLFRIGDTQASNTLIQHIRSVGVDRFERNEDGTITGEKVHYSWRHGFVSQLEDLTTPDRSRFLSGHAAKDIHARNYLHHEVASLKKAVDGITYPVG